MFFSGILCAEGAADKAGPKGAKYAAAYFKHGNALEDKGLDDKALSDYSKAIDIKPRYTEAFINRGNIYYIRNFKRWIS